MADTEKQVTSHDEANREGIVDKSNIAYERAQLLANLPDPDEGKTEEERLAIVSDLHHLNEFQGGKQRELV